MTITLNGTTGITNDSGYTGDGISFADSTPANTLVTTSGGNVGVGTASPATKLHISSSSSVGARVETTGAGSGFVQVKNSSGSSYLGQDSTGGYLLTDYSAPFLFYTNNTERMRIDSSGNLLVGTTSPYSGSTNQMVIGSTNAILTLVNATTANSSPALRIIKSGTTNNTSQIFINFAYNGGGNGNGAIAGNGDSQATFITQSDARLKENIKELPPQLDNIMALRPVEFDYIASGGHQIGFIAQEVQEVYPDLVSEDDEGFLNLAGLDKNASRLIKAIQEQQAIIQSQADIITAMEARLTALENK